jgi:ABC-type uncharacterized transport system permease subunit
LDIHERQTAMLEALQEEFSRFQQEVTQERLNLAVENEDLRGRVLALTEELEMLRSNTDANQVQNMSSISAESASVANLNLEVVNLRTEVQHLRLQLKNQTYQLQHLLNGASTESSSLTRSPPSNYSRASSSLASNEDLQQMKAEMATLRSFCKTLQAQVLLVRKANTSTSNSVAAIVGDGREGQINKGSGIMERDKSKGGPYSNESTAEYKPQPKSHESVTKL